MCYESDKSVIFPSSSNRVNLSVQTKNFWALLTISLISYVENPWDYKKSLELIVHIPALIFLLHTESNICALKDKKKKIQTFKFDKRNILSSYFVT